MRIRLFTVFRIHKYGIRFMLTFIKNFFLQIKFIMIFSFIEHRQKITRKYEFLPCERSYGKMGCCCCCFLLYLFFGSYSLSFYRKSCGDVFRKKGALKIFIIIANSLRSIQILWAISMGGSFFVRLLAFTW